MVVFFERFTGKTLQQKNFLYERCTQQLATVVHNQETPKQFHVGKMPKLHRKHLKEKSICCSHIFNNSNSISTRTSAHTHSSFN